MNATRLPKPRLIQSPRTKTAKFLRNAIQRQMWNKRQRPHDSSSNSSSGTVGSPDRDATQYVQQRTIEQVIDVPDDAGTEAQQRTVEQVVPKATATPAEKREESLQALRKATNKSSAAEETMRKHNKKPGAARKALEDLQAKTADLGEKRKEACVEPRMEWRLRGWRHPLLMGWTWTTALMKQTCGFEEQQWPWPEQNRSQLQNGGKQVSTSATDRPQRKRRRRGLLSMLTVLL